MWNKCFTLLVLGTSIMLNGCSKKIEPMTNDNTLKEKLNRFAPTVITADTEKLSASDRSALKILIEAGKVMDEIFLQQAWSGNPALLEKLKKDSSEEGKLRLQYFLLNYVPWSGLDNDSAFLPDVPPFPPEGANFYPENMTKYEFNKWIKNLSQADQEQAKGFFTTIRRGDRKELTIVPYSAEYTPYLQRAARLLRQAADSVENITLKTFLQKRADAFMSNSYYASDVAWMDIDAPLNITIGPYETYQDRLFNYKATFEAFITLRDEEETSKLTLFGSHLQELENNLPLDPHYRNPSLGASSPIRVVDLVFAGGDTKGVQTAAFNLPNDEKVVKEKGSKRVMLKNVQEAKFEQTLIPISKVVMDQDQQALVSFNSFFTHILAHELMHGLGPHNIIVNGNQTTVRAQLQELHSAIEEAKADITGLWALQYLMKKGIVDSTLEQQFYCTYLASAFRSVRFGTNEAHGKGITLQFNFLMDEKAFVYNPTTETFRVDGTRMQDAVKKLTNIILTLQAEGDKKMAKKLLDKYGTIRQEMKKVLGKLHSIPVDIRPEYVLAE